LIKTVTASNYSIALDNARVPLAYAEAYDTPLQTGDPDEGNKKSNNQA